MVIVLSAIIAQFRNYVQILFVWEISTCVQPGALVGKLAQSGEEAVFFGQLCSARDKCIN
jgi:hypothetical protein